MYTDYIDTYNKKGQKYNAYSGSKYFGIHHSNSAFLQTLSNINFFGGKNNNLSDEQFLKSYADSTDSGKIWNVNNGNINIRGQDEEINLIQSNLLTALDLPFIKEAQDLLVNIFKNSVNYDQISLEFICFKNSQNPENIECAIAIILAILKYWKNNEIKDGIDLLEPLLKAFLMEEDNQEDFLFWWQEYCAKSNEMTDIFADVLDYLDELEIVSYESFDSWEKQQEDNDEKQLYLFKNYISTKIN